MTETTRPISLFNKIEKQADRAPTVFVTLLNGKILSVSLSLFTLTVNQAILQAIQKFNSIYQLDLIQASDHFQMYGAKKNGKKKSDLPALSRDQVLSNTGLSRFCLNQLEDSVKSVSLAFNKVLNIGQLKSIKSIQTDFTPKKIYLKNNKEIKEQNSCLGCFYLGR